jgi:hypothetical protein
MSKIFSKLTDEKKLELYSRFKNTPYKGMPKLVKQLSKEYRIKPNTVYSWRVKLLKITDILKDKSEDYMYVKGKSTLLDKKGKVKLQWVKEDTDQKLKLKMFRDTVDSFLVNVKRDSNVEYDNNVCDKDIMTVYTIGDAHIGMLASKSETGNDHNLDIACKDLLGSMKMLVNQSNNSEECFIVDVGDYFHTDTPDNRTRKSGNVLDVDGNYNKILDIGFKLTTELIDLALKKHKVVRWRSAIGNHNETTAVMMSMFIKAYYREDSRVIVHDTPNMFMYHKFGKNLIGITHGHTVKADALGEIMSVDCEDIWSDTKFRYFYLGHVHHISVKEYRSCVVETFRTLAPRDSWHNASGYRSMQDMKAVILHKDYGEISRNTVNVKRILDIK